jgi:putative protein-disulfide isomerase
MVVKVRYYTDPACPWSWAAEPFIRKLIVQFGGALEWKLVMGGLAKEWVTASGTPVASGSLEGRSRLILEWLQVASVTRAPIDPLLWVDGPPATSYPACMAVKAAGEQGAQAQERYLRRLREGLMCERRKLDHAEALVEEARGAGLDVERFRIGLRSHATMEAFAGDLEETERFGRELADGKELDVGAHGEGAGGAPLPSLVFTGEDGIARPVAGYSPYERYREAAAAAGAGASSAEPPTAQELIDRFGRVTTREVEVVCELPGPRAGAELFRLAEQWKLRPLWKMTEYLWEAA